MQPVIFIVVMVALMWLLVIRPQRRRTSELAEMTANLSVGDEIVTAGGMYGRIERMDSDVLTVEIAPETSVRIARGAVTGVIRPEDEQEPAGAPIEPGDR